MKTDDPRKKKLGKSETIENIEKETDNFIAEHLRVFKKMWERERSVDDLNLGVERLHAKSTAFSRSVKAANSKLRTRYIRNLSVVVVLVLFILVFLRWFYSSP